MHAAPETAAVCSAAAAAAAAAAEPILHTGVRNDQTPKVFFCSNGRTTAPSTSPPHFFVANP